MNSKKLLFDLINASDETEVQKIIDNDKTLNNPKNWAPYGDNETNFNTVLNQQGRSVEALIDKPINSIHALLLRECKLRGINPKRFSMPKTNVDYWREKIERNKKRDKKVNSLLKKEGWKVIGLWEEDIKKNTDRCLNKILHAYYKQPT